MATNPNTMPPGAHRFPLTPHHVAALTGAAPDDRPAASAAARLGRAGEALAVHHLEADHGFVVVARNWRLSAGELRGELDVVALDHEGRRVVVCEVKARRDAGRFGGAVTAVSERKRARIRVLAAAFLREAALPYRIVRLDLVAIDVGRNPSLSHLEGVL